MLKSKFYNILSNWNINRIFDWPEVKRARFVVLFSGCLALYMVGLLQAVISMSLSLDLDITSLNLKIVKHTHITALLYISIALLLFISGAFLEQASAKMQMVFVFLSLMIYSAGNVIALYYIGTFSIIGGVAMAGGPVAGLLLFDWRIVLFAFVCSIIASIVLSVLSMMDIVPYAALIHSNSPLAFNYVWFFIVSALVVPQVISILYIAIISVIAWRLRENTIRDLSQIDELTQLSNRRVFMQSLPKNIEYATDNEQPLSLMILDLDHFKLINDEYGHQMGDYILKLTSRLIKNCFETAECLARYGGEEFCIILTNTTAEIALQKAEQLRASIDQYKVIDAPKLALSASIGVFTWNPKTCPIPINSDLLLETADQALYQAKRDGRNCVRVGSLS